MNTMTSSEESKPLLVVRVSRLSQSFIIIAILVSLWHSGQDIPRLISGFPYFIAYVKGMFPPDFSILPQLTTPLIETFCTAVAGISIAAVIALPMSFLVARNTNPSQVVGRVGRIMLNVLRSLPTLLWAILFVSMVGLGPLAGVFALVCHCVGTFGKLFSEAMEATGPKIQKVSEAMQLDGATDLQVVYYGLLPEVIPLLGSYVLYYLEWGIRASTILGLVGAGGIGLELTFAIRSFHRQRVSAIIIIILVLVTIVDSVSGRVREGLLQDG